jgi:2'-5' RNA ligase
MARLFFASWPPAATAGALAHWAAGVQRAAGGRALDASRIHLTLAFLGEVTSERAAAAVAAARGVRGAPHELPLEEARYWAHNRIVWVGPRELPASLEALAALLAAAQLEGGFALERRRFAAHVTLLRKVPAGPGLPPLPKFVWPVEEFTLVRSTLAAGGSRYEILERFALR